MNRQEGGSEAISVNTSYPMVVEKLQLSCWRTHSWSLTCTVPHVVDHGPRLLQKEGGDPRGEARKRKGEPRLVVGRRLDHCERGPAARVLHRSCGRGQGDGFSQQAIEVMWEGDRGAASQDPVRGGDREAASQRAGEILRGEKWQDLPLAGPLWRSHLQFWPHRCQVAHPQE